MRSESSADLPNPDIFRAYDIRGVVGETLTAATFYQIGRAFAAEALAAGDRRAVVGGDGRDTTEGLRRELLQGLREGGLDVVDIGCVPTPLMYYATHVLETGCGLMITGSHNPPEYNGLKMMIGAAPLTESGIQRLRRRIERNDMSRGSGALQTAQVIDRYIEQVAADVTAKRPLKVVADCGNGVAGLVAPRLLATMGCDVVALYAEVDGSFPNHHPDPAEASNLDDLIAAVERESADVGVAFDGDGDRLGVVTNRGEIIWPDRAMMLFAKDILLRNCRLRSVLPESDGLSTARESCAAIVFDVKCSRHLPALVREYGGEPIMWRTGHSHIKAKIRASGALLGGEFSGHLCFADRWYGFDDATYSAARLIESLAADCRSVHDIFAEFPAAIATPEIKIATTDSAKFEAIRQLQGNAQFNGGTVNAIDGVRVDYADGWGLVRASNTSPVLSLRFEADSQDALLRIQDSFDAALRGVDPSYSFLSA